MDSSGRNGMMREKITRWAEQTASRQWHDLEAMIVIWTRQKEHSTNERGSNEETEEKIKGMWEWVVERAL